MSEHDAPAAASQGSASQLWYCAQCTRMIQPPGAAGFIGADGQHYCPKCAPVPQPVPVASGPRQSPAKGISRAVIRLPNPPPAAAARTEADASASQASQPDAAAGRRNMPLLIGGSICALGLIVFVVGLFLRAGSEPDPAPGASTKKSHTLQASTTPGTVTPSPQDTANVTPDPKRPVPAARAGTGQASQPDAPISPTPPATTIVAPQPSVVAKQPEPAIVPARPEPVPPPVSTEGLQDFTAGLPKAAELANTERFGTALDLLNELKRKYAQAAWWPAHERDWSVVERRVQQQWNDYAVEAQDLRERVDKDGKVDLDKVEAAWKAKAAACAGDRLAASPAQELVKAVAKTRARILSQVREKKSAEITVKLDNAERQIKGRTSAVDAVMKTLDEVETEFGKDPDLAEKLAERWAGLRVDAGLLKIGDLAVYGTKVIGGAGGAEVAYDFAAAEELRAWSLDDPAKNASVDLDARHGVVLLKAWGGHNWEGKDRRNMPVYKLPFYFRPENWAVETAVELVNDAARPQKPDFGLLLWDGSEWVVRLSVQETPGKGCTVLFAVAKPRKENFWGKPQPLLPGGPKEPIRLRLSCVQGIVTGAVINKAGVTVATAREQLGFEPRFVGLFVRNSDGAENATAAFHNLRIAGVPNYEVLRPVAAGFRLSAAASARSDLLQRLAMARAAAHPDKGVALLNPYPKGTVDGKVGKAFACDGQNTFFDVPHSPALEPQQLTLAAWIYLDEYPAGEARRWIASKNVNEHQEAHYALIIENNEAGAYVNIGGGGGNFFSVKSTNGAVKLKTWQHLAMAYDGVLLKVFVDGAQAGSVAVNKPRTTSDKPFCIGRRQDGGYAFKGLIDEVRLYSRALPEDDIKAYVRNPAAASHEGLVGCWSFDD